MGNNLHDMACHSWLNSIPRFTSFSFAIKTSYKKQETRRRTFLRLLFVLCFFSFLSFFLSSPKLCLCSCSVRAGPNIVCCQGYSTGSGGCSAPPHLRYFKHLGSLIGLCMNWSIVYSTKPPILGWLSFPIHLFMRSTRWPSANS